MDGAYKIILFFDPPREYSRSSYYYFANIRWRAWVVVAKTPSVKLCFLFFLSFFFPFFLRDNRLLLLLQADPILLIQWPGENGSKVSASVLLPFSYRSPVVECDFNPLPVGVKRLTRNRGEVWLIR